MVAEVNAEIKKVSENNVSVLPKSILVNEISGHSLNAPVKSVESANISKNTFRMNEEPVQKLSRKKRRIINIDKDTLDSGIIKLIYEYYHFLSAVSFGIFFGIVFEIEEARSISRSPVGPTIAILCNFILSPLVREFFHQNSEMCN